MTTNSDFMDPRMTAILEKIGGEITETVPGQKVVFKFPQPKGMLMLIDAVKADPRFASKIRLNSQLVAGVNFLTVEKA